ncbi:MAG: aspartate carbamoyltransferase [archaeon]
MKKLEYFIDSRQLDRELILSLFEKTRKLKNSVSLPQSLRGKILATLFYEPSTRTRLSFESAIMRLGGSVISTENAKEFSSAIKGESLEDTIRIVEKYCDCIVMRHYEDGTAQKAVNVATKPIINAGDGKGQHPTQALLDAYTIYDEIGRLDNITVAFVGDLANGRTTRSLSYLLGKFDNVKVIFVSPENLKMKDDIKEYFDKHKVVFLEESDLTKVLPVADIIYMTRIQKERMTEEDYLKAKGKYCITEENLKNVRPTARVMHPLPHVEEISLLIETETNDKRVAYFRQAENGLYTRMALLDYLLKPHIARKAEPEQAML